MQSKRPKWPTALLIISFFACESAEPPVPHHPPSAPVPAPPVSEKQPTDLSILSEGQTLSLQLARCKDGQAECLEQTLAEWVPEPANPRSPQDLQQRFEVERAILQDYLAQHQLGPPVQAPLEAQLAERHAFAAYLGRGSAPRVGAEGEGLLATAARTAWAIEAARLLSNGPDSGNPSRLLAIWEGREPIPRGEPGPVEGCAWSGSIPGNTHLPNGQTRPSSPDPAIDARLAILAAAAQMGANFAQLKPFYTDDASEVRTFVLELIRRRPLSEPGVEAFLADKSPPYSKDPGGPGSRCGQIFWAPKTTKSSRD